MRKSGRLLMVCFLCLVLVVPGVAQKKRHRKAARVWGVPEIYSNVYLLPESGDVGGMEVILTPVYGGTWATVVIASGIAYEPILVPVKEDYPKIEFTLPAIPHYEGYGTFTGKLSAGALTLSNKNLGTLVLKKQCR